MDAIKIFKGNDTNFNDGKFLTFSVTSNIDLSDFTGVFTLGSFSKPGGLADGKMEVVIPAEVTSNFPLGPMTGIFKLIDTKMRVATVSNTIPFEITDQVFTQVEETVELQTPEGYPVELTMTVGFPGGNYGDLDNKPQINNVTLVGNKTASALGLTTPTDLQPITEDISALQTSVANKQDALSQAQLEAANSGIDTTKVGQIATNTNDITAIEGKIPAQATAENQLADKNFVNSTVATNTANFIGTFNSVAELEAYSGTVTNNDYAFVATEDQAGNTLYDRYKYNANTQQWVFEYELNNSSFTAVQWAALNSGATATNIGQIATNTSAITSLGTSKQDVISDLSTIRSGASAGATALQPATAATTYVPLSQKGVAAGVATLDNTGKITDGQINYATATRVGGIKSTFDGATGTWTVITEDL